MRPIYTVLLAVAPIAMACPVLAQEPEVVDPTAASGETVETPSADRRDQEARQVFEAGRMALEDGRYEDALEYFERAYELSGRVALLFNIGTVAERLRRDRRALEAYQAYVEAEPGAPNRAEVDRRIAILTEQIEREDALLRTASDPSSPADSEGGGGVLGQWWFWTVVGAVVAGGAVAVAVALSAENETEAPLPGTDGVVLMTLRLP